MVRRRTYRPNRVHVSFQKIRRASWTWSSRKISGDEFTYEVVDRNFDRLNRWTFTVHVPQKPGQIVVQPQTVPGKKAFAELRRRSIIFNQTSKHPYGARLYCKVHLSDPTGIKNWTAVRSWEHDLLPQWFKHFETDLQVKSKVAFTRGTDGDALVILAKADDHEQMIRIYFALRVWVLQEEFVIH